MSCIFDVGFLLCSSAFGSRIKMLFERDFCGFTTSCHVMTRDVVTIPSDRYLVLHSVSKRRTPFKD